VSEVVIAGRTLQSANKDTHERTGCGQVANQDHSVMQGVEAAENVLSAGDAVEETLFNPRQARTRTHPAGCAFYRTVDGGAT
jgi:hypothetical protein